MPQVPTSFVPQVGVQGEGANVQFVAPGIAPMENLAAQQQVQLGRATESLGNTVWRIGQIIEDDINTAKAKGAEGAALDAMEGILNGDGGYMYSQGQDADARFSQTEAAIAERVQGAMQGLDNDVQKAMFQQSMSRALTNARSRMNSHRNNEVTKWQAQESDARAKRYVGQAINAYDSRNDTSVDRNGNPTGQYATNVQVALEEARKAGRLLGYPEDSEAMQGIQRGVMDGVASGVVGRLIDRTDYNGAMAYLGSIKDQLNPATHERLLSVAYSGQRKAAIDELANNILNYGRVDSVALTRPYVNPVPGGKMMSRRPDVGMRESQEQGVVITGDTGAPVHAPYDGQITAMEPDETGLSLKIQLDDGRVAVIRGLSKNSPDVGGLHAGKRIGRNDVIGVMGGVKLKGVTIDNVSIRPTSQITYALFENDQPLGIDRVNSVSTREADAEPKPPKTLHEALAQANLADPAKADVKALKVTLRQRWAEREEQQAAAYEQLALQVDRIMAEPGADWRSVPPALWGQLSAADQEERLKPWRAQNDLATLEEYARAPGAFTVERVMKMRGELTRDTYNRMLSAASSASNQAAQADAQLINVTLIRNKVNNLAFPETDEDKAASLVLRQSIEDTLRSARKEGPITEEKRQQIIDNAIISFGSSGDAGFWATMWGSGKEVPDLPLEAMTPEQRRKVTPAQQYKSIEGVKIPTAMYDAIRRDIMEKGLERPTNAAILTQFTSGATAVTIADTAGAKIEVPIDRYYALRDAIVRSGSQGTDQQILELYKKER